jgi:hypothetical protein
VISGLTDPYFCLRGASVTAVVQIARYVELHASEASSDHNPLADIWLGLYDHVTLQILDLSRNTSFQIRKIFIMVCSGLFGTPLFNELLFVTWIQMANDKVSNVKIEFGKTLIDFFKT